MRLNKLTTASMLLTGFSALTAMAETPFPQISINANVIDTVSQNAIGKFQRSGDLKSFFQVEKKLVYDILSKVGIDQKTLSSSTIEAINEIPTKSFEAFQAFSVGLDFKDKGMYKEAAAAFQQAAKIDPKFKLVQKLIKQTPTVNINVRQLTTISLQDAQREVVKDINNIDVVATDPDAVEDVDFIPEQPKESVGLGACP